MWNMSRNVRTYDHFCLVARTLERVGDRWSLLVIRDLLTGAKRFTDLMDRLGGITPKTLSQRLRELEDEGIVTADRKVMALDSNGLRVLCRGGFAEEQKNYWLPRLASGDEVRCRPPPARNASSNSDRAD